ncbi:MAG: radical SAM family heme chaperone HemW [Saprospiraceae bacterium]|nr:radical SAM family heme chaperone HemW [Saprospiraceae bacterium]
MAGIYIHIPFCKQACVYCNFHFSTSLRMKDALINAICHEIELRHNYLNSNFIETIYFGGGTPSLLTGEEINKILENLSKFYTWNKDCEITLEANPDDIDIKKIKEFKSIGVNRLSIGIQSFHQADLEFMNRAHNSLQADSCIKICQDVGISNLSIDLIYGSPTTTDEMWTQNIIKVTEAGIPHISSYCLTVEEKTVLQHRIMKNKMQPLDEEQANRQFSILMNCLNNAGYEHYEISNFSLPGFNAIHNTNYWKSKHYLGLGPSAHSFDGISRSWNIAHNKKYFDTIITDALPLQTEILTLENKYNEFIMTRLRTMWGVNTNEITELFGQETTIHFLNQIKKYITERLINQNQSVYTLTENGKYFADKIAMELFL